MLSFNGFYLSIFILSGLIGQPTNIKALDQRDAVCHTHEASDMLMTAFLVAAGEGFVADPAAGLKSRVTVAGLPRSFSLESTDGSVLSIEASKILKVLLGSCAPPVDAHNTSAGSTQAATEKTQECPPCHKTDCPAVSEDNIHTKPPPNKNIKPPRREEHQQEEEEDGEGAGRNVSRARKCPPPQAAGDEEDFLYKYLLGALAALCGGTMTTTGVVLRKLCAKQRKIRKLLRDLEDGVRDLADNTSSEASEVERGKAPDSNISVGVGVAAAQHPATRPPVHASYSVRGSSTHTVQIV